MWQSPAIFLQHSISAFVIVEAGRHARAGAAIHIRMRTKDGTARHFNMSRCYMFGIPDVKPHGILMWAFCIQAAMPGAEVPIATGIGDFSSVRIP